MNARISKMGAALLVLALLAGCAASPAVPPTATPPAATATPAAQPPATTSPAQPQPVSPQEKAIVDKLDDAGRQMLAAARDDLAGRLKVKPDQVRLVKAEIMRWSDSSLGCPQPGMMYAQVITPGYQFILEVDGKEYDYRASQTRVALCEPQK
jgi:hypothetical protein